MDSFDSTFTLRHDLSNIIQSNLPFSLISDSESLFKVVVESIKRTEKRLMIDLQTCRGSYQEREIDDVVWVKSDNNVADGLTKLRKADLVKHFMRTRTLSVVAYQWVEILPVKKADNASV